MMLSAPDSHQINTSLAERRTLLHEAALLCTKLRFPAPCPQMDLGFLSAPAPIRMRRPEATVHAEFRLRSVFSCPETRSWCDNNCPHASGEYNRIQSDRRRPATAF